MTVYDLVMGTRASLHPDGEPVGLTSRVLGQVVALHNKLRAVGGRLVLCEVSPFLDEVFETAELPGALCIREGEDEGLKTMTCAAGADEADEVG